MRSRSVSVALMRVAAAVASRPRRPRPRVSPRRRFRTATAIRVDGELNDAVWQTVPADHGFRQRDPNDGAAPTFETEARVAYDATALYIAVQAFDPEPATHRRHPHAARRRIAVRLDPRDRRLVPRPALRLRVRRQPRRRQAGHATGSTTATTIRAGTRCGTSPSRAASAAGARSSAFRSRSCAFRRPRPRRSGSRSSGRSAG